MKNIKTGRISGTEVLIRCDLARRRRKQMWVTQSGQVGNMVLRAGSCPTLQARIRSLCCTQNMLGNLKRDF